MAIQSNFPAIRPSLDLNFAGSRTVDPRITFTRASTATYFDEFGVMRTAPAHTPRIDFDPVTGECKGLLIEEQRTNLLTYSEQFDNEAWGKTRSSITANATIAPDGTLTADKLVEDTSPNNTHWVRTGGITISANGVYSCSLFVRAGERNTIAIQLFDTTNAINGFGATFNLDTLSVTAQIIGAGTNHGSTISAVGGGWYRVSVSGVVDSSSTSARVWILAGNNNQSIYTGDGTSGIYIWGAQLETGNAPTSYIPTTSAQVTRAGDILSLTGLNASSWYKQDEGTFLIEFTPYTQLQSTVRMLIGSNPGYIAYFLQNSTRLRTYDGTSTTIANNGAVAGSKQKAVVAYSGSSVTLTIDGANPVTGTFDGGYGADIYIGCLSNGTQLNGWIRRISYYPKPLQNSNLLALTA